MNLDCYTGGEQEFLLKVARKTLETYLTQQEVYEPQTVNQKLWDRHGVVVGVKSRSRLPVATGCLTANVDNPESVMLSVRNGVLSLIKALDIVSFSEVESDNFKIVINILINLRDVNRDDIVRDSGIVLTSGESSFVCLPDAWHKFKDKNKLLDFLCQQAGLSLDRCDDLPVRWRSFEVITFTE